MIQGRFSDHKILRGTKRTHRNWTFWFVITLSMVGGIWLVPNSETVSDNRPNRRVNVPYLGTAPPVSSYTPAVFWFGRVDETSNHADVRVHYFDSHLRVVVHIIDRRLWYDTTPSKFDLTLWDSVSLFLDLDGNEGNTPDQNAYRFIHQLNNLREPHANWQAGYQGNDTTWETGPLSFTSESGWRGDFPNNEINDKGWVAKFDIPFSTLGFSEPPLDGTTWGMGIVVHDRDGAADTPIPEQVWPEQMDPNKPVTWGQLHFGRAQYNRSNFLPQGLTMIQRGLNGAAVPDAHVGGNFTCGDSLDHWSEWGEANYAGSTKINIQNQWDISDYPCFSKYFVTFPMDSVPIGKVIVSARLRMTMFGNAGGGQWGEPPDSYIQVFTIGEAWDESILNWNNAPLSLENISGTWVKPTQTSDQREYSWDVSKAVTDAYQSGGPVRLALYSADGPRHTGKYFWSSDVGEWNAAARPTLQIIWGIPCDSPGVECTYNYLPAVQK